MRKGCPGGQRAAPSGHGSPQVWSHLPLSGHSAQKSVSHDTRLSLLSMSAHTPAG